MSQAVISVYLGSTLCKKWGQYCKRKGVRASSALRNIVTYLISKETLSGVENEPIFDVCNSGNKARVEIRISISELEALKSRALVAGYGHNRYISSLISTHLSKSPTFGQHELDQITASNSQLLMIGRSLNQMARKLNTSLESSDQLKLELIEQLSHEIKAHVRVVADLIEANIQRWQRGQP